MRRPHVLMEEMERLESGQQTLGHQIDGTNVDDWIECLSNRRTVARCAFGDSLEHGHGHRSETNYFLPLR